MLLTNKLLSFFNRPFSKDPVQFLALRISCDTGRLKWKVADGFLTLTPISSVAFPISIDLSQFTLQALKNHINAQPGYLILYNDTTTKHFLSALTLLDGSGNIQQSNGDHLYAYTSLLFAWVNSQAGELELAQDQIVNAIAQMSTTSAGGEFLDLLGTYYKVPRNAGELDPAYGPRIIAQVLLPSTNNVGMAIAMMALYAGTKITVPDAITNPGGVVHYDGSHVFDGSILYNQSTVVISNGQFDVITQYNYGGGQQPIPTLFAPIILATAVAYRAAGTYPRNLIFWNSLGHDLLILEFTLGLVTVFIYDQAPMPAHSLNYDFFFLDDEDDDDYLRQINHPMT